MPKERLMNAKMLLEAVIDSLFRQIVKNKSKLEKRMKAAALHT